MLLEINNVKKTYGKGLNTTIALNHMNLSVRDGEFVAIMGESGSGKSTLLNMIALYDDLTEGDIIVDNIHLSKLKSKDIAQYRQHKVGFVFQDFNLLPNMTNKENIVMPLILANHSYQSINKDLEYLSNQLFINDILDKYPTEVSGGQQQRIAIARALITHPMLLLADEPTGALDSKMSQTLMELLQYINVEGQTILMVTHSNIDASYARRVIFIKDGRLFHEIYRGDDTQKKFQQRIADSLALINGRSE